MEELRELERMMAATIRATIANGNEVAKTWEAIREINALTRMNAEAIGNLAESHKLSMERMTRLEMLVENYIRGARN